MAATREPKTTSQETSQIQVSQIQVNQIQVSLTVTKPKIKNPAELEARITLTNASSRSVRLNTLFFDFAVIMLKVRRGDGTPVSPGPPPVPPIDDGKTGRIDLPPLGSTTFVYRGSDYFAEPLPPGAYEVRFRYENTVAGSGDWTGLIETGWVPFEVTR